jgi:core-2/I-Branching enzyme
VGLPRPSNRSRSSVAYLIRAHHRPTQLVRLVERLNTDSASFHVHVSARTSEDVYAAMREGLAAMDNVRWVERVPAYYSGFSLMRSVLVGLEEIAQAQVPPHVVMLSGQDYPLRPAGEIEQFLARRNSESLVEHFPIPTERWSDERGGLDRIRYLHLERLRYRTKMLRIPFVQRTFPSGLQPYGGSAWSVLSDEAVRVLLAFERERPDAFSFFRHVRAPDEIFIQTVLLNSPIRERVANESIHHIEWPGGSHPSTLRTEDFPRIAGSGKLFARKFDTKVDPEILDVIDRELLSQKNEPAVTG